MQHAKVGFPCWGAVDKDWSGAWHCGRASQWYSPRPVLDTGLALQEAPRAAAPRHCQLRVVAIASNGGGLAAVICPSQGGGGPSAGGSGGVRQRGRGGEGDFDPHCAWPGGCTGVPRACIRHVACVFQVATWKIHPSPPAAWALAGLPTPGHLAENAGMEGTSAGPIANSDYCSSGASTIKAASVLNGGVSTWIMPPLTTPLECRRVVPFDVFTHQTSAPCLNGKSSLKVGTVPVGSARQVSDFA